MSDTIPGPDSGGPVFGFHGRDCKRIRDAVRRKEGYYLNRQPRRGRWGAGSAGGGGIFADSGSGLAAGSRSSPSNAVVTLLEETGSSGGLTTGSTQVKAYNHSATAVGASKTIVLSLFAGKYRVEQVIDC